MKCNNCGYEYNDMFEACPNCGSQPGFVEPVSLNPMVDMVLAALKDGKFLTICILLTITCVISLFYGSVPLITVLITIFLWLTYADAKKGFANANHLKFVSGAVYANYVITNVCGIIFIVGGILSAALSGAEKVGKVIYDGFSIFVGEYEIDETVLSSENITTEFISMLGWIFCVTFVLGGALALLFNILGLRKIHRFARSVYQGIMYPNNEFINPKSAKNWLMFFGICAAVSALSSIGTIFFVASGCEAAATIIASTLIKEYFVKNNNYI